MRALILLVSATAVCAQPATPVRWSDVLRQQEAWYGSDEARTIAENVLRYQRDSGGWPKDIDMAGVAASPAPARPDATIDNGATTTQIRFLAKVARPGKGVQKYRDAALRGIDYLLAAQYSNGGWPQFFPLRNDYSRHITFNDHAMVNVMTLLEEVAGHTAPFEFVDEPRRKRAADAGRRAIPLLLRTQVVVNGIPTAWGAQHDEVSFEPRPARTFEPVALASMESVGIVGVLLRQPKTPEIIRAVEGAVAWFKAAALPDDRWARFYEIGTNRPIFAGRDGVIRYSVDQIEAERRDGYAWYGTWPRALLDKDYPRWRTR
jgi:PelA/Pel-15E family pectate lyase